MVDEFELKLESRIGIMGVRWNDQGLLNSIRWLDPNKIATSPSAPVPPIPGRICEFLGRLHAYFESGEPLGDIPWDALDTQGWSPFQSRVYTAISKIPHGETRTYGWTAIRMGTPFASRAVGQALRRNPLMILIPCHRVLPSNGGLGGFMGEDDPNQPELMVKKRLLELEHSYRNPVFSFLGSGSVMPALA